MKVTVRNGNVNKALSIFKRKCMDVVQEVREREYYEKPTLKRNRKKRMAVVRERKRQAADRQSV